MTRAFPLRARGRPVRRLPGEMNKTEAAYADHLEARRLAGEIRAWFFEPLTLRLAKRTTYTPDFVVLLADDLLEFHEVKGFWQDDARVKFKVAMEKFAWLARLVCVTKRAKKNGGGWNVEEG